MRWNLGAFAGSAFGMAAWMGVPALMGLGAPSLVAGLGVVLCTATAFLLWRSRGRLSAHAGLQAQIAVSALAALGVVVATHATDQLAALHPELPAAAFYAMLLVFPLLSVAFWIRERRGAKQGG